MKEFSMYSTHKKIFLLNIVSIVLSTTTLTAMDSIFVTNPVAEQTVNGQSLIIQGSSSGANMTVDLLIDYDDYTTNTDASGNWSIAVSALDNGIHTLSATLSDPYTPSTLATQSFSFTVIKPETITISHGPIATVTPSNPILLSGTSSLPLAPINILLDGSLLTTTTTDAYGDWNYAYMPLITSGIHTFAVQLMANDNVTIVANTSANIDIQHTLTITNPISSAYGTVSGKPLTVNGTASLANAIVRLAYDNIPAPAAITDASGNWSSTYTLNNDGKHIVLASLATPTLNGAFKSDQVTFTVDNPPSITIATPTAGSTISYEPINISGTASLPSTLVHISLDGTLIATTTTDSNRNWQSSYAPTTSNGPHTLLVELMSDPYTVLASATVDVTVSVPIIFPSGKNQVNVVAGMIPTTGSGSGPGYIYTISGSIATINFTPAFSSMPSIIATGLRASGSSTVSVTAITPTATSIAFSTGTQYINFTAALFL